MRDARRPLLLLAATATLAAAGEAAQGTAAPHWFDGVRSLLEGCPGRTRAALPAVGALAECARKRAWTAIDDILEDDVIPLVNGLELVRFQQEDARRRGDEKRDANFTVTFSVGELLKRVRERTEKGSIAEQGFSWYEKLTNRLARILRTHVIRVDVERFESGITERARSIDGQVEPRGPGRRRRRRQMQMMPIIMMGVLLMGSVLIPMGFQFLAVLGGKALILAKMALMLSSIQGLKKVATSGVNYGLYHSPVPEAWHERSSGIPEVPYAPSLPHAGYNLDDVPHYVRRSGVQST